MQEFLAKLHLFSKGMHVVGFVSWFAGLFYVVRLFIYHVESTHKPEPARGVLHAQFVLMERRLWLAITVPAMVITLLFGGFIGVMYLRGTRSDPGLAWWLYLKLGLVAALVVYHQICGGIRRQLAEGRCRWTSAQLRQWNELATFLLVAIVMLAVFKTLFSALWGTLALVGFGGLLALACGAELVRNRWTQPRRARGRLRSERGSRGTLRSAERAAGACAGFGNDGLPSEPEPPGPRAGSLRPGPAARHGDR